MGIAAAADGIDQLLQGGAGRSRLQEPVFQALRYAVAMLQLRQGSTVKGEQQGPQQLLPLRQVLFGGPDGLIGGGRQRLNQQGRIRDRLVQLAADGAGAGNRCLDMLVMM